MKKRVVKNAEKLEKYIADTAEKAYEILKNKLHKTASQCFGRKLKKP